MKNKWKGYKWFCFDCLKTIKGNPDHRNTRCLSTHSAMKIIRNK